MSPSASAALPLTSGDRSVSARTSASLPLTSPMRPMANAAIWRTSGSSSASSATSGSTPSFKPDAPDGQRGTAANARLLVGEQPHQTRYRRRRRDNDRGFALDGRGRRRRRRRLRIVEHALVLQPHDPRHLLFERRSRSGRRGRRRDRRTRTRRTHQCECQHQCRARHGAMISSGALQFRYIAVEGPIGAGKTPLAERLATRLDATLVLEETDNPFLADFYGSAGRGAAGAAVLSAQPPSPADHAEAGRSVQPDHHRRLPLRQGQDLRVSQSGRQRALHLSAPLRSAGARRPASRSGHLPAGADRHPPQAPEEPSRRSRERRVRTRRGLPPRVERGLPPLLLSLRRHAAARRRNLPVRFRRQRRSARRSHQADRADGRGTRYYVPRTK